MRNFAACLRAIGTHFVTFCDSQGGDLQKKLMEEKHRVPTAEEEEPFSVECLPFATPEYVVC